MSCKMCKQDVATPEFTMAFQPIVDLARGEVFACESLVRPVPQPGRAPGSAHDILSQIDETSCYAFDQACRMNLTRGIQGDRARRAIVRAISGMCEDLGISLVAEGIEHADEVHTLLDLKVNLFQGFLFARPAIEALPALDFNLLRRFSGPAMDLRHFEAS